MPPRIIAHVHFLKHFQGVQNIWPRNLIIEKLGQAEYPVQRQSPCLFSNFFIRECKRGSVHNIWPSNLIIEKQGWNFTAEYPVQRQVLLFSAISGLENAKERVYRISGRELL